MSNNPLKSHSDRRKQRIDDLAASAGDTAGGLDTVTAAGTVEEAPGVSLIASAWRRLRRNPVFLVGATITLIFIILALISPWIAPHDPAAQPLLDKVRQGSNPVPGPEPASRWARTRPAGTCSRACSWVPSRPSTSAWSPPCSASPAG